MDTTPERNYSFFIEVNDNEVWWRRLTKAEAERMHKLTEQRHDHINGAEIKRFGWHKEN